MPAKDATLLTALQHDEEELVFDSFDNVTAWNLGQLLVNSALTEELPLAIAIRRNGQRLFHAGLPGSSADNDGWMDRKMAVVDRFGHSSYLVGELYRSGGGSFDADSRLDTGMYAAHGGAFPVLLRGTGCIGSVAASGLPEADDHEFVTRVLRAFLTTL